MIKISLNSNKIQWEYQFHSCFNLEKYSYFLNYRIQLFNSICYFFNQKYQIQMFSNTLILTINKSKNTKFSLDVISTNTNNTKFTLGPPNSGIFKVFQLFVPTKFQCLYRAVQCKKRNPSAMRKHVFSGRFLVVDYL